jgi:hypothetical protein
MLVFSGLQTTAQLLFADGFRMLTASSSLVFDLTVSGRILPYVGHILASHSTER